MEGLYSSALLVLSILEEILLESSSLHIRFYVFMEPRWDPRGYSLLLYTGGSMSIFGVWDFTKQSYLGSVKNSYKKSIFGVIELQHKKYSIFGVLELTTKL